MPAALPLKMKCSFTFQQGIGGLAPSGLLHFAAYVGLGRPARPDVTWSYALRFQDFAARYDLGRHARRVEGGRRHRAVRVGLDLRPLLPDLFRRHWSLYGGLDHPYGASPGDDPPAHGDF